MPTIPTTFTGENSGATPIYTGGKTESAISQGVQNILQANKQKVAYKREDDQNFLKALSVDPMAVGNQEVMLGHAKALDDWTNRWTEISKASKGKMSLEQQALMAAEKTSLMSDRMQAQSEWDYLNEDIQNFKGSYHDPEALAKATENYFRDKNEEHPEYGHYQKGSGLRERALTLDDVYNDLSKIKKTRDDVSNVNYVDGVPVTTTTTGWTEPEAKTAYKQYIQSKDSARYALEKAWGAIPEGAYGDSIKKTYLTLADTNNDKVYDVDEKANAVLEFGFDTQGRNVLMQESVEKGKASGVSVDRPTADQKNARLREEQMKPENLSKTGVPFTKTGYGWKPVGDGFMMTYRNDKTGGYDVPSDVFKGILPDGLVTVDDFIKTKPSKLKNNGTVDISVTVRKIKDTVDDRKRKKELNKLFTKEKSSVITDGTDAKGKAIKYYKKGDSIYRLGTEDEMEQKKITMDYDNISDYMTYFDGLKGVFNWVNNKDTGTDTGDEDYSEYKRK